jgi:plastocyanin
MRRAAISIACIAGVWLAAAPASAGGGPGRLLVTGTEYNLTLSHARANPGDTIIQFRNDGEDAHDMKIMRVDGATEHAVGVLQHDQLDSLEMNLKKGASYELWCSLETPVNHRDNGMEATLQVRKHPRR